MSSRMNLYQYEGKIVRMIDTDGRAFTGIPVPEDLSNEEIADLLYSSRKSVVA